MYTKAETGGGDGILICHIRYNSVSFFVISMFVYMLLMTFPLSVDAAPGVDKKEYIFSVVPQSPPEVMHRNWTPFIERIFKDTGLVLKLKVYENMDDFENDIKKGNPHFMYLNASQAVMARMEHNYIPLVRSKKPITGKIFVRKDSPIKSIDELREKDIAFVGPKNICTMALKHDLKPLHVTPRYVGTSSNVYKHVLVGEATAGGTLDVSFEAEKSDVTQALRPIYTTQPITAHPIAAHPSVAAKTRQEIRAAVLRLADDAEGRKLLDSIRMQNPTAADYVRDYKPLEAVFGKVK